MATNQIPVTLTPTPEAIPAELAPILRGEQGLPGDGMPAGGTEGQVLAKASATDFDLEWVDQTGGGGAGATNLAYTASPTGGTVTSDTGTDATIPLADGTNAGLMAPDQHTKLASIAAGATAVSVDAAPTDGSTNAVSSNGVFDALAGKSDSGHNHTGTYDPAGTATSALSAHTGAADPHSQYALESALGTAAAAATTDFAPAAHVGAGGTAHADAVAAGAAGFMSGADKTKLDGIAAGAQVNPTSTDALSEGATNLYHTASRVLNQVLTGLSTAAGTVVEATHSVLQAIGFLQKQVSDNTSALSGKAATGAVGSSGLTMSTARLLGRSTASTGAVEEITVGSGLTLSDGSLTASSPSIAPLQLTDANTVEQYNSTTAQVFRVYNTRTDASNYERGFMRFVSNVLEIGCEALGTGTARLVKIKGSTVTLSDSSITIGESSSFNYAFASGYFRSNTFGASGNNNTALTISANSSGDYARAFNITGAPAAYAGYGTLGGPINITAGAGNSSSNGTGGKVALAGGVGYGSGKQGVVTIKSNNEAPDDATLSNSDIVFYLDQSGNNLKVRVKYSDGTLKTATIALA